MIYGRDDDHPARRTRGARQWAQDRRDLADQLAELAPSLADKLELPEPIPASLARARATKAPVARKRHLKHLAGLLRQLDDEAIEAIVEMITYGDRASAVLGERAVRWRERLLDEGDAAVSELVQAHPGADGQRLRQLARNARREGAGPKALKALLGAIQEALRGAR